MFLRMLKKLERDVENLGKSLDKDSDAWRQCPHVILGSVAPCFILYVMSTDEHNFALYFKGRMSELVLLFLM